VDREATEAVTDLRRIRAAGHHLLALINDVLDLSKIEAGKMELHLESFDVRSAIDAVASTVSPLIEKNGNVLALVLDGDLGTIHADVTRVRQVLFNLLSNASKFTERGTITLAGSRRTEGQAEWIELTVRDTGIGMTPEQLGRLFNAFAQAETSTAKKYGGTGLGLVISRMFCEMMGGTITVASEAGVGTAFTVRIPVEVADPSAASIPEVASEGEGTTGTVLVIDDDPATRDLLGRMLSRDGYRVLQAANGAAGLALARAHRPDVITLDVVMPGLDGWEVLSALKEDPEVAAIPVVMLTITDDRNLGFSLGASEYLTKPIERERLVSVLSRYRRAPGASVLIVEDDGDTRTMLRRSLEKEGWTITEAENGRVGLEKLQSTMPTLILLDLMMPEMDGFQFLEALRAKPGHADTEVVVMTAKVLTNEDRRLLNGGVQRVLQKGEHNEAAFLLAVRSLMVA
jgi:CheY-like chemotaxis protein/anti-sigma regulatory factor (Ser/Thr protein kinase)